MSAKSCDEGLRRYLFCAHLDALNAVGLCCLKLLSQIILVQAQSLADGFDIELFCGAEVIVAVASGRNLRDVHDERSFRESGISLSSVLTFASMAQAAGLPVMPCGERQKKRR